MCAFVCFYILCTLYGILIKPWELVKLLVLVTNTLVHEPTANKEKDVTT